MFVQFLPHEARIDVRGVLDGNFDRFEPPLFERLEQRSALVGEGRREQKGIDAESHNGTGFADRLEERGNLSKGFAAKTERTTPETCPAQFYKSVTNLLEPVG